MTKLFEKSYIEMTAKEIRDELVVLLCSLRKDSKEKDEYFTQDYIRQYKEVPVFDKNGFSVLRYTYPDGHNISIGLIKELQIKHSLKDSDTVCITYDEEDDGWLTTSITFISAVKETDLEYYQRIKELYLEQQQEHKVHKFILDVKKRTGVDTPYYQANKMLEIFEEYKKGNLL